MTIGTSFYTYYDSFIHLFHKYLLRAYSMPGAARVWSDQCAKDTKTTELFCLMVFAIMWLLRHKPLGLRVKSFPIHLFAVVLLSRMVSGFRLLNDARRMGWVKFSLDLKELLLLPTRKKYLARSGHCAINPYSVADCKFHRHLNVLSTPGE